MLCGLCQGFDVRSLLCQATASVPKQDPPINWNYPEVLGFYKHRAGLSALKQSAENGCDLCMLFWDTCTHVAGKEQVAQVLQGKNAAVEQDIYIGTDAWNPQTHNLPNVVITQNHSYPDSDPACADLKVLGLFEVYAERGSVPPEKDLVFGRNVYQDPSSDECLAVASEWLETCSTTHKNCPNPKVHHSLPTRVIDVGPPDGSEEPFVFVSNGQSGVWAALSYCWGGNSSFVLKQDAARLYRREIPLQEYPATIRDAIVVTRKLNIRFLWVDALCIIQDSADDWEYEAARMTHVYKNALVTIAAAQSPTSFHGILKQRPLGLNCKIPWGQNRGEHVFLRAGTQLWDDVLRSSTLDTRGWTLQETLLAPRTVLFGQQQMFWECATYEAQEGGRTTKPAHIYRNKSLLQDMFRSKRSSTIIKRFWSLLGQQPFTETVDAYTRWLGIVGEYTSRRLTNDMDILPALSGLAGEFHRFMGDRYLAGLWEKDLIHSLMWTCYLPPADEPEAIHEPTQAYRAPSWSWASLKGVHIAFPARGNPSDLEWEAEIVNVEVTLAGADPFGRLMGGSLTVKAPFQVIGDVRREESTVGTGSKIDEWMSTVWSHETSLAFQQAHRDSPGQHFALIQLRRWSASPGLKTPSIKLLLLESTGSEDEYRRLCRLHLFKQEMREESEIPGSYDSLRLGKDMWEEVEQRKWEPKVVTIV